jgi:hypothetical protein
LQELKAMADTSLVESGQFSGSDDMGSEGKQTKSLRRDIVLVFLSVLAIVALVLLVAIGSLLLLQAALLQAKLRIAGLPPPFVWLMQWRNGLAVIVALLLLALISFALARWRAGRNRALGRQHAARTIAIISGQSLPDDVVEQSEEAPMVSLTEKRLEIAPSLFNYAPNGSEIGSGANVGEPVMADLSAQTVPDMIGNFPPVINSKDATSAPTVTLASTNFLTLFENTDYDAETLDGSTEVDDEDLVEAETMPTEKAQIIAPFRVNLRVDPQSNAEVLGLLDPGTEVALIGKMEYDDGIVWRQVKVGEQSGWLVNAFLQPYE